ncbi:MAG: M48 family metallopeptidase [Paracoccaceae bacterium]
MSRHHLPGNPPVPVLLRRSARARRISLRVSQLDGRVTLTLPSGVTDREALAFAQEKAEWVRGHLAQQPDQQFLSYDQVIPVEGRALRITPATGRRVLRSDDEIAVPQKGADGPGPRLQGFLRELARDRLSHASDLYADKLGKPYAKITIRDTRSRWGSCSAQGALMYSWRLILAPPEVLEYVAAHEVAHLQEMNHSPDFWAVVEHLYGDYAQARGWLRREGNALHRYIF